MNSTGAARAGDLSSRRIPTAVPAPVLILPQERPPPTRLLELLKTHDARAGAAPWSKRHAWKVATCRSHFYRAHCGCGKRLLPASCKDRLCPQCERARAARAVAKYEPCFHGRAWVRHLIFTIRRAALGDLKESIDFLGRALRRFRHYVAVRDFLAGGTTSIETKGKPAGRDTRGGWHTHAHVLTWGRGWLTIAEISLLWCQATGGRVNWRKFRALPERTKRAHKKSGDLKAILSTAEESPIGCVERHGRGRVVHAKAVAPDGLGGYRHALREALKYVTKSAIGCDDDEATAGWTVEMVAEFYSATRNRNLFQKFGDCPAVGAIEAKPCERCGESIHLCENEGCYGRALTREDAEAWANGRAPDVEIPDEPGVVVLWRSSA